MCNVCCAGMYLVVCLLITALNVVFSCTIKWLENGHRNLPRWMYWLSVHQLYRCGCCHLSPIGLKRVSIADAREELEEDLMRDLEVSRYEEMRRSSAHRRSIENKVLPAAQCETLDNDANGSNGVQLETIKVEVLPADQSNGAANNAFDSGLEEINLGDRDCKSASSNSSHLQPIGSPEKQPVNEQPVEEQQRGSLRLRSTPEQLMSPKQTPTPTPRALTSEELLSKYLKYMALSQMQREKEREEIEPVEEVEHLISFLNFLLGLASVLGNVGFAFYTALVITGVF